MDQKTARFLTKSLISRLVDAGNDQWQLQGTLTSLELQALQLLIEGPTSAREKSSLEITRPKLNGEISHETEKEADTVIGNVTELQLDTEPGYLRKVCVNVLEDLQEQQSESQDSIDIEEESSVNSEHDSLLATELSQFILPSSLDNIKDVLLRVLGDHATLGQLIETSDEELLKKPTLGQTKLARARALQQDILDGNHRSASNPDDEVSSQCIFGGLEDVSLEELERVLLEDIEQYVDQLDEKSHYIFVKRNGWKTALMTGENVGRSVPGEVNSRARIGQIQEQLGQSLIASLRVSPKTLWINIKSNLSLWGESLFPQLRDCFTCEKDFYRFLELCCGVKKSRVINVTKPIISLSVLDEYWTESISPVHFSKLVDYLQSEHGFEHAVAENALVRLNKKGVVKINGEQISPQQLSKPMAIAHLLLLCSEPLPWRAIHEKVNSLGFSKTPFSLKRQDSSIGAAVDNGWIYQCGHGEYQTLSNLELSEQDIDSTLFKLKACLEEEKRGGRDAVNLSVGFYEKQQQLPDYFIVRHIVRTYGEREGVFFNGKSGSDTVSLDSKFSLVSQEKDILQMFVKTGGTLTRQDIANSIRSQSINHAGFYLDLLMKAEKIVRVSAMEYALTAKAFEFSSVRKIVKSAAAFLAGETRVVEGEVLQRHLNREFDLENNKYFYLSLLRIHAGKMGYEWHYSHNLISRFPLKFSSVTELYRQVVKRGASNSQDIFDSMSQCLRADGKVLSNTISASKQNFSDAYA